MSQEPVYRIIDANFNRAREALRLMEEYCRFALDSRPLTERAKRLRHSLCAQIAALDPDKVLFSRDSAADVGKDISFDSQMSRKTLTDCFTAAAKRASEALRALAEMTSLVKPDLAGVFETLRFDVYSLEKDVVLCCGPRFSKVKLYVLINAAPADSDDSVLDLVRLCIESGTDCLQLRPRGLEDKRLLELACRFVDICRDGGVLSIINDRADIAALSGAAGLHLGQTDIPIDSARKLQLKPVIIGLSTHSLDQLQSAIDSRPDYIALGPVFPSPTKPDLRLAGIEYISAALAVLKDSDIPPVAIGGINTDNLAQLIDLGLRRIAVCSPVSELSTAKIVCRRLKDMLNA